MVTAASRIPMAERRIEYVRLSDVPVPSPYSYWFACRPRALETRPVRLFHDWLVTHFGERDQRAAA